MSHFLVSVFGHPSEVEDLLAPYDEQLEVEPYRSDLVTQDDIDKLNNIYMRDKSLDRLFFYRQNRKEFYDQEAKDRLGIPFDDLDHESRVEITTEVGDVYDLPWEMAPLLADIEENGWRAVTLDAIRDAWMARYGHDGEEMLADDDSVYQMVSYNPQGKWDWWVAGGRWGGSLLIHEKYADEQDDTWGVGEGSAFGRTAKQEAAIAGDELWADWARLDRINWAGMEAKALEAELENYRSFKAAIAPLDDKDYLDERRKGMILEAQEGYDKYQNQGWLDRLNTAKNYTDDELRTHLFDRAVNDHGYRSFWEGTVAIPKSEHEVRANFHFDPAPFAMVTNEGEWVAKGDMGWFGLSRDTEDQESWNAKWWDYVIDQDPDTYITMVDCHS